MFPEESRTPHGKVVLYEVATGKRIERWTVDARELLTKQPNDFTLDPSKCQAPAEAAPPEEKVEQTEAPKVHPLGGPVVATKSTDAAPATPLAPPQRSRGGRARNS